MTTPDGTGATAPEPTEATANIVEQATTAVDAESVPQAVTIDEVRDIVNSSVGSLQGSIASRSGQDRKMLDGRIERIENAVTVMADGAYEQKLSNMTADEQAQFLYEENKKLRTTSPVNDVQQQENNQWLGQEETSELAAFTDGALAAAGVQALRNDARLWTGAQSNMNLQQLKEVAQKNIVSIASPSAQSNSAPPSNSPAPTNTPPEVPPTMQDAPTATIASYSSRGEMAKAALAGEIDSNQIAEIMKENGWR